MKKMERLAELASRRAEPAPLDAGGVMARLRGLAPDDYQEPLPLRLFAGGAVAAAAAAAFAIVLSVETWREISNPALAPLDSLINLTNVIGAAL